MKKRGFFAIIIIFTLLIPSLILPETIKDVRIGVLSYRGREEAFRRWSPTADYLSMNIHGYRFSIVPLGFDEIGPATRDKRIDFIITNTSIYVELEAAYGVSRIATLKNRWKDKGYTVFGGVIFTSSHRKDINDLKDLKGKTFMAVDETSLGGWRMAWREIKKAGLNPYKDLKDLRFGRTHDRVVMAVLKGEVDAGTVRTDVIERMADSGLIDIRAIKVLNEQRVEGFSFLLSTGLYPEWPFAKLRHVPEELSEKVALALLSMPGDSIASIASESKGWTIPLNYQPVHDLMKELRVGPYRDYGRVTFRSFVSQYWYVILLTFGIIIILTASMLIILRLNKRLRASELRIRHAMEGLDILVKERTSELEKKNRELQQEIALKTRTAEILREAEKEREAQRQFLQSILDSISESVMVIRPDYRIEMSNRFQKDKMKEDTFCYKVSHGRDLPCDGREHPCPLKEVLEKGNNVTVLHKHLRHDGSEMVVEISASPVFGEKGEIRYVIEASRDITERVRLEEKHRRLMERLYLEEKEASLITLTGGIAHDFNNILMGVMGSAELLRLKAGKEDLPYIDNIIKSSERMAELVSHLLAFTGQTIQQPKNINVNDSIMAGLNMAQKGRFQDTTVRLDLYDDLWPVFADATLIQQMMINLIINAFEAIEGRDGSVSIKTSNIDIKSPIECSPLNQFLPEGEYIKIEVSDTGHGIPKEVQRRVFEPFFTTRFPGRGLGLAAVAGIVKSHNGCISLESEEGKGTTFTIYLPRSKESEIERKTRSAGEKKGRGILVVDDEETILNLIRETLSGRGYEVYCSKDGIEALETFRKNGDKIGLAILDIEMPGMDGRKLISELRSLSEDIKIIVSSGYDEETALMGVKPAPEGFIQKPYRLSVLLEKVKEVF